MFLLNLDIASTILIFIGVFLYNSGIQLNFDASSTILILIEIFLYTIVLCSIVLCIINVMLSKQTEKIKVRIDEKADQNERLLFGIERLLFGIHSQVFDKAEQILLFQESFIFGDLKDICAGIVDETIKSEGLKRLISSNFKWTKAPNMAPIYSDWKIEIDAGATVYYVHRYVLGARSKYFNKVFVHEFESATSTSRVSLQKLASAAFPSFLDFLYTGHIEVGTGNAVALYWLSDYFGVPSLKEIVGESIAPISDKESCLLYLEHAHSLDNIGHIKDEVNRFCNRNPDFADHHEVR